MIQNLSCTAVRTSARNGVMGKLDNCGPVPRWLTHTVAGMRPRFLSMWGLLHDVGDNFLRESNPRETEEEVTVPS